MVVVQGGQVPEFQIEPDPAKLLQAQVTVPGILDAVAKSNMIDSPGLLENNHELSLALVSGQTRNPEEIANIVVKTTPAGVPVRIGDIANVQPVGDAGLYDRDGERQAGGAAESCSGSPTATRWPSSDAVDQELAQIRKTLPPGVKLQTVLRPVDAGARFDRAACATRFSSGWFWRRSSWCSSCATGAVRWWPGW